MELPSLAKEVAQVESVRAYAGKVCFFLSLVFLLCNFQFFKMFLLCFRDCTKA